MSKSGHRGFVDEAQLNVRGGDGGAGCVSMRREAHVPSPLTSPRFGAGRGTRPLGVHHRVVVGNGGHEVNDGRRN